MAVYYDGQLVVDLCGGYKDASSLVRWTEDTRTVVFSVTKVSVHVSIACHSQNAHFRLSLRCASPC